MRKKTNANTVNIDGLELPINTKDGMYYCYVEPLESFKRELDAMLSWHCKVFMLRFDIRLHEYTDDNKVISKFIKTFIEWAKRHYGIARVGYAWCREIESAKNQHYHLVFMFDGNKIRAAGTLTSKIEEIASVQNLSHWICKNPTYMIHRSHLDKGDYSRYNKAFYRASYLAKERGKTYKGERANSFQTSRVKPQLNEHGKVFGAGDDYSKRMIVKAVSKKAKAKPKVIAAAEVQKLMQQLSDNISPSGSKHSIANDARLKKLREDDLLENWNDDVIDNWDDCL